MKTTHRDLSQPRRSVGPDPAPYPRVGRDRGPWADVVTQGRFSPGVFAAALLTAVALLTVIWAWDAGAQEECLTELFDCKLCVQRTGNVDISECKEEPSTDGEAIDPSLLQRPDVSDLDGLHGMVAGKMVDRFDDVIRPILVPDSGNRIYVPRELFLLSRSLHDKHGSGDQWRTAAEMRWLSLLVDQARRVRLDSVPDGTGGRKLVIKSTDVLVGFILSELDEAGAFDDVDLAGFEADRLGAAVTQAIASRVFTEVSQDFEELMRTWAAVERELGRQELFFRVLERLRGETSPVPADSWTGPGFEVVPDSPSQAVDLDTGVGAAWRLSFDWTPGPGSGRRGKFSNLFWFVKYDESRGRGLNREMLGYALFSGRCRLIVRAGMGVDHGDKSRDVARFCPEPGVTHRVTYEVDLETGDLSFEIGLDSEWQPGASPPVLVRVEGRMTGGLGPVSGPLLVARGFDDGDGQELPHVGTSFGPFVLEKLR